MSTSTVSTAPPRALVATQLACRRGRRLLFQGLELTLAPGALVWLRGTNGSGKTSLMRMLAGLAVPESGDILFDGQPIRRTRDAWHAQMVYISHGNALKEDLSLTEALGFLARLHGRGGEVAQVRQALEAIGVAHRTDALVRTLSQGQRRRGALARLALDEQPRVWILDEPYDALDRDGIAQLDRLILANAARGGSVLLTSHQPVSLPGLVEFDLETVRAPQGRR